MKKGLILTLLPLAGLAITGTKATSVQAGDPFSITIAEKNNIANWKYDWNIVNIGGGHTSFDNGHLRMENLSQGSANYAMYVTNKFNEFRVDMHANLNLVSPKDLSLEDGSQDYCNLYFTYFIDFEDAKAVNNVAQAACPWTMNKGWMSVCFERLAGVSKVQILVNETFDNNGGARYFQTSSEPHKGSVVADINYVDNSYHWFTIDVTSVIEKKGKLLNYEKTGSLVKVLIDGELQTEWFMADSYFSNTRLEDETIPFHEQKGYFGLWASSGYTAGHTTADTNAFVDIDQMQVTSYDGLDDHSQATPYERCPLPEFHLEPVTNFAPAASYDVGEEMEIRLSDLFTYDGVDELTYTATSNGQPIGEIKNGFFVWTPTEAGRKTVKFTCTDGIRTAINDVRFICVEPYVEPDLPQNNEDDNSTGEKNGCSGSIISASIVVPLIALGVSGIVFKKKKRR